MYFKERKEEYIAWFRKSGEGKGNDVILLKSEN